jgi:hypothetical protein
MCYENDFTKEHMTRFLSVLRPRTTLMKYPSYVGSGGWKEVVGTPITKAASAEQTAAI